MAERHPILKQLPNYLTILRISLVPALVVVMLFIGKEDPATLKPEFLTLSYISALILFALATTDFFDGYLARRLDLVTTTGKFLDPIADKFAVMSAMIMCVSLDRVPAWMVVVIIGREMAVTGLRGIASSEGIVIESSMLGKYKTTFQYVALVALLLHYRCTYLNLNFHNVGTVFLYIALIFTLWSGIEYFLRFSKAALSPKK